MKTYDIILVGTGQATGTILPDLLDLNFNIGIVESDKTGGTCVNWGCTGFYHGQASFLDDHTIKVGDETLYGDKIIIHTGTRARIPQGHRDRYCSMARQ